MNTEGKVSSDVEKNTAEMNIAGRIIGEETGETVKPSGSGASFGGAGSVAGLPKGGKPRRSTKIFGPSKVCEKMYGPGKATVGTQVDIRVLVSEKDLEKEKSKEAFWRKMAETTQAAVTELRDDNRKLHTTIDYLSRENVRYQNFIEDHIRIRSLYNQITFPNLPPLYGLQEEESNDEPAPSVNSSPI